MQKNETKSQHQKQLNAYQLNKEVTFFNTRNNKTNKNVNLPPPLLNDADSTGIERDYLRTNKTFVIEKKNTENITDGG